ncbi:Uncharacterised protein [Burkholderia pseudomallei]|nr:Uncharacterised protein [Burkholderia pseudomallei]
MGTQNNGGDMNILSSTTNYRSLSVKDLLEAREHYHAHLTNKPNVIGTAIGLYLIRKSDPPPSHDNSLHGHRASPKGERTFENSEVRPYSWPCVLVLVDTWVGESEFSTRLNPVDAIPQTLYMPDGRTVPVCVVKVAPTAPDAGPSGDTSTSNWPDTRLGGGFPLHVRAQGRMLTGSVGCLVTDGHTIFALTNRHVIGRQGESVFSTLRGREVQIGEASSIRLARVPFNDAYDDLPFCRGYVNLDIGLVELDDANDWTSRVYGLSDIAGLADLNVLNLGTQLIEQPVSAYGAASGPLKGCIKALFYRYQSVGGYDYVADFLIAPADGCMQTRPGDSGTVWHLQVANPQGAKDPYRLCPIAVEWGGQGFADGRKTHNFSLATNLSNVCRLLDVELVSDYSTGVRPFWGATGHYSIARYAIDEISNTALRGFMLANATSIAFDRAQLEDGQINAQLDATAFVPLADVPDIVWKKTRDKVDGGRDTAPNVGPEHPNHFADVDQPGPNGGPSLLQMCLKDPQKVSVRAWQVFYDSVGHKDPKKRGLLPFRVWQIFDAMVTFAKQNDYARFLAAAGVLAHYVADACQPLHGSMYSNGYDQQATSTQTRTGKPKQVWPGQGVHSAYEDKMIDENAPALFDAIEKKLKQRSQSWPIITGGQEAAIAIVQLMDATQLRIPPRDLCDTFIKLGQGASRQVVDGLWQAFGDATAQVMSYGVTMLAHIWESAWKAGCGAGRPPANPGQISMETLQAIYRDASFVPSLVLDQIGPVLR